MKTGERCGVIFPVAFVLVAGLVFGKDPHVRFLFLVVVATLVVLAVAGFLIHRLFFKQ